MREAILTVIAKAVCVHDRSTTCPTYHEDLDFSPIVRLRKRKKREKGREGKMKEKIK